MQNQLAPRAPDSLARPVVMKVSPAPPAFRLGHRPYLDGFRGVAVLLIIVHHARLVTPLGVDIFFVLSGFLITALLIQEWDRGGRISLGRFYARRALRLFPALFLLLVAVCLHALVFQGRAAFEATGTAALAALGYASNWVEAFGILPMGILYHTWSLAVEEQFYVCWPLTLLVLLKLRLRPGAIVALLGAGIVLIVLHRTLLALAGAPFARVYVALDTRGDALLLGCILGFLEARRLLPQGRVFHNLLRGLGLLAVTGLGLLLLGLPRAGEAVALSATLAPLAAATLLLFFLSSPPRAVLWLLESRPLVWTGQISYGLYLWNFPACYIFTRPSWPYALAVPIQVAVTFAAAAASFYFWERPFLRLKQRFAADGPTPWSLPERTPMALLRVCKHTLHPRLVTPQSVVVDAGANKGEFSHALIEAFGCRCYAIEPNPEQLERIGLHPLLSKHAVALHERNEPVVLNIAADPEATSLLRLRGCDYIDSITVNGQTLESFVRNVGIGSIDVLKLDIEGAELAVLNSCADEFLKGIGQITIEFHNDLGVMSDADVTGVVDRLRRLGFYVLYPGRRLTPWDVLFVNGNRISFFEYCWIKYGLQVPTAIRNRWHRLLVRIGLKRGGPRPSPRRLEG